MPRYPNYNAGPQNMGLESRRNLASGGNTAGLAANPTHGGQPPLHGTGPSLVPNGMPTLEGAQHHAMRIGQIQRAVKAGKMPPHDGAVQIARAQAYIDRHASMKRAAAVKASKPTRGPSFGSISDGSDDPNQTGLLTNGNFSDVPSGSAIGTTKSPQQQQTSGGFSQVPNASSGFNRRGGPGY